MSCQKKNNCCQAIQDYLVCTCMGVMKSEIVEAIESGDTNFDALAEKLGVGTGCESCVEEVNQMLKEYESKNK